MWHQGRIAYTSRATSSLLLAERCGGHGHQWRCFVDFISPTNLGKESDTKVNMAACKREADKRQGEATENVCESRWSDTCTMSGEGNQAGGWAWQPVNFIREARLKGRTLNGKDVHAKDEFCHSEVEFAYDSHGKMAQTRNRRTTTTVTSQVA